MTKGKKIALIVSSSILAVILLVVVIVTSIIGCTTLDGTLDFESTEYNVGVDAVGQSITVASYNIRGGYTTKETLESIRAQIETNNVDIIGVQEVDADHSPRTRHEQCVGTLTSGVYEHHYFAPTMSLFLRDFYGIMTMAKTELVEADSIILPLPNKAFMLCGEPRVCIRTIVNVDGVDVAFYNTHLSFENGVKMPNGMEMREAQLMKILSLMESDPCAYKVLVGDMNILSFDEYHMFKEMGGYTFMNNENNVFNSYRGDDVDLHALDNIIFTDNMRLVEAKMIDNDLSDHNMLMARLEIVA